MKFSLCMIVKNEENTLRDCLDSVKSVFDEIIIVDTGSIDSTKKICEEYTDKIYDFMWCDDFAAARNFSFSKATGDFIMWLDADDVVCTQDSQALLELKQNITLQTDVVMMKYVTSFDESGNPYYFYYRERLIKRLSGLMWTGFVHEVIPPSGNIIYEDISIYHMPKNTARKDPARNLKIYEKKLSQGCKFTARETYYYARELYYNQRYDSCTKHLEQFLMFPNAWYADKIGACVILYNIYVVNFPQRTTEILARALSYDKVNPQILCYMGDEMKKKGNIEQAIFWYNAALSCPKEYSKDGFILPEFEAYYPLLQLCVCYDAKGEYDKAKEYNRLAGIERPQSEQVKHNEKYFASLEEEEIKVQGGEN